MKPIRFLITATLLSTNLVASMSASAIEVAQIPTQPSQQRLTTPRGRAAQPPIPPPPSDGLRLPKKRTVWQRGRTLRESAGAVESTFRVNNKEGTRLILDVAGNIEIQSAQVQFADGQVQPITSFSPSYTSGQHLLLDFGGKRRVQSVQVTGKSNAKDSAFSVQLLI
jgi:hypothetical protein